MTDRPKNLPVFDLKAVRRSFDKASSSYDDHAVLQEEVADRLIQRLDWLKIEPEVILDIGAGTGKPTAELLKRFPKATVFALDLSAGMLKQVRRRGRLFRRPRVVCGDARQLPLQAQCVDLVFSSLSFQWCDRLDEVFREIRRILTPDAVLLFSTFGPDTLKELRASWDAVDEQPHVHRFADMHDVGDMVVYAGLQEPVMERDEIVMTYTDVQGVMADLKYIGASNALQNRSRGLMGKQRLQALYEVYRQWQRPDGRYPATYEIVYGTAWSGQSGRENMATIAIEDIGRKRG